MEQNIPNISDDDIKRIIKRDFSQLESTKIESILQEYEYKSKKGMNRVRAAVLKLSNGDIELTKRYVEKANNDYRDIIALSEYPNYSIHAFDNNLSEKKKKQLIHDDWIQYEAWLNKSKNY